MTPIRDPCRPLIHYTPRRNWMNDPNGLIFHRGLYHVFYQYNPFGTVWGHMSWGHATSPDLLAWREQPVALAEDSTNAIFSGSIVADPDGRAGFGAGALVAIYTGNAHPPPRHQTQNLAWSHDDGLNWTKFSGNPVLDLDLAEFRDPKVFWHAPSACWVMVVARSDRREILFYASDTLRSWRLLSAFGPAGTPGKLWECPDLFVLTASCGGQSWMLKVDVFEGAVAGGSGALAFFGNFDGKNFIPDRGPDGEALWQWVDYGRDFYASASWNGLSDGRVIWIAWMNSHHYAKDMPEHGWRGSMTLPRELGLYLQDGLPVLTQTPVREWRARARLYAEHGPLAGSQLKLELPSTACDIEIRLDPGISSACRFALKREAGGSIVIAHDPATATLTVDRSDGGVLAHAPHFAGAVSAPLIRLTDVRIIVDTGSIEVFANGGLLAITEQILGCETFDHVSAAADAHAAWLDSLRVFAVPE